MKKPKKKKLLRKKGKPMTHKPSAYAQARAKASVPNTIEELIGTFGPKDEFNGTPTITFNQGDQ